MDNKVYVGKIVSTHGIKGEIRILSDFDFFFKIFFYIIFKRTIFKDDY